MNLGSSKPLFSSVMISGLLAAAISISACQKEPEPEPSLEEDIATEQAVPMSAEPAEPNDMAVAEGASLNEVQDDTIATVNTGVNQLIYLCSPELKVEATYKDDENQVVIVTDKGTLTLTKTNEGSNPEVFKVETAIDGTEGATEWSVAHTERETGVMRTAGADASNISTYECDKTN